MSRVLIAWELGAGLGHVSRIRGIAERLVESGHEVCLVLRDLKHAERMFGGMRVSLLQAPFKQGKCVDRFQPPSSFPHILHNTSCGDLPELQSLCRAWRCVCELAKPDLVLFDHSPTAMLAARGFPFRRATIGTGFCLPPSISPMADLRPWQVSDPQELAQDEQRVLQNMNAALRLWDIRELSSVGELYADVDCALLTTYRELDHFPQRPDADYLGTWQDDSGTEPQWPSGFGKRIFAYLKRTPNVPELVRHLAQLQMPTIVYAPGAVEPELVAYCRANHPTLGFSDSPISLNQVSQQCDIAIGNATHGMVATMLLAGKPCLSIPIHLEQQITANNVQSMGAGLTLAADDSAGIGTALHRLLVDDSIAKAAGNFAGKYGMQTSDERLSRVVQKIERLLE